MSPADDDGPSGVHCRLDELLEERGMTLTRLSELVGVSVVNLSILKNDRARAIRYSTGRHLATGEPKTPPANSAHLNTTSKLSSPVTKCRAGRHLATGEPKTPPANSARLSRSAAPSGTLRQASSELRAKGLRATISHGSGSRSARAALSTLGNRRDRTS